MATGVLTHMNMVPPRMTTDLLTLSQLFSPGFPIGAFAYSHGLEIVIAEGEITSRNTLQSWLLDLLEHGSLRSDAVLVNLAMNASHDDLGNIDAYARAFMSSEERLKETDLQGAAFCETVNKVWGMELERLCYPVAVGRTAAILKLDPELTTGMFLQSMVMNLTTAAMRLVPLGQVDGQKLQLALKPYCVSIGKQSRSATFNDLHNNSWLSDIASMRHETQYSRVFRT